MKKSSPWKRFTIIVSSLISVLLVCVIVNFVVIEPAISGMANVNAINNGANNAVQGGAVQNGGAIQNGGAVQNGGAIQQGDATQQGVADQNGGGNAQVNSPLAYDKAQLVEFYNTALKKSYTYKLNATKVEQVDVAVSGIDIGNLNLDVDQFAQNIIANNTKKNGVKQTKSFVNGKATDDGSAVQKFILPTDLYADAVQDISIAQHNGGYKMVIKLKAETCAHNGTAKYNASCTWPLDVGVIDFGQAVTIQECTFNYPGTVLTALIDSQGRVYGVQTEMPLNVTNAKAKAVGVTIKVGSISGKWTCKNELKFL